MNFDIDNETTQILETKSKRTKFKDILKSWLSENKYQILLTVIAIGTACLVFIFAVDWGPVNLQQPYDELRGLHRIDMTNLVIEEGKPELPRWMQFVTPDNFQELMAAGNPFTIIDGYDISFIFVIGMRLVTVTLWFLPIILLCSACFYIGDRKRVDERFAGMFLGGLFGFVLTILFMIGMNHLARAVEIPINFGFVEYATLVVYLITMAAGIIGEIFIARENRESVSENVEEGEICL